ncbi:MAG: hypothetical protein IJQ40_00340 [Bacilli bacterium]|nr:hypothetical protein [Bacilli bacterium]
MLLTTSALSLAKIEFVVYEFLFESLAENPTSYAVGLSGCPGSTEAP